MTAPRMIRPGATWFVTRRTTRRHFLLRPDADGQLQNLFWYVTALMAAKYGVEVHAVQVLSTHIHEVLTDKFGYLPAFLRDRNRLLANALKCLRHWPEEVFQRTQGSCIELFGSEAVAHKIAYTLANCVEAGLVRDPSEWPGVTVTAEQIGSRIVTATRPGFYLAANNPQWPERVELEITMPEILTIAHGDAVRTRLAAVVTAAIEAARATAKRLYGAVGSPRKLLTVPFTKRASSAEPIGTRNPAFATAGNRVEAECAIAQRRSFLRSYRDALAKLRAGLRHVDFPIGTWRWVQELGFGGPVRTVAA